MILSDKAKDILFCVFWQGDRLFSQAHDDIYQFSFERQRWGPLALRPPKKTKQEAAAAKQETAAKQEAAAAATDAAPVPAAAPAPGGEPAAAAAAAAGELAQSDGEAQAQPSGERLKQGHCRTIFHGSIEPNVSCRFQGPSSAAPRTNAHP